MNILTVFFLPWYLALLPRLSLVGAGHIVTEMCDIYESAPSNATKKHASILEYHWEKTSAHKVEQLYNHSLTHIREYAQDNHHCSARRLRLLAAVHLVVDTVTICPCSEHTASPNWKKKEKENVTACTTRSFRDTSARKAAVRDGLARMIRVFIGDSRMSGEARTYLHMLVTYCDVPLEFGSVDPQDDSPHYRRDYRRGNRDDFTARCGPLNSSMLFFRDSLLAVPRRPQPDAFESIWRMVPKEWQASLGSVQVIVGSYVWNIIERGEMFIGPAEKHTRLVKLMNVALQGFGPSSAENASHRNTSGAAAAAESSSHQRAFFDTKVVVRTSPPVCPSMPGAILKGPLNGNLPLIRGVHDAWVASEVIFATQSQSSLLQASKIMSEYQAALEIVLGERVPLSSLFVDKWHPCVPLVTQQWVGLLPYL